MTILKYQWGIYNFSLVRVSVLSRCKENVSEGVRLGQLLCPIYGNVSWYQSLRKLIENFLKQNITMWESNITSETEKIKSEY